MSSPAACGSAPVPPDAAGSGVLEFSVAAGRSVVTRALAHAPLKLLTPRPRPESNRCPGSCRNAAWAYATTFGGGLVAGDDIRLAVRCRANTSAVLTTQASTKIYPSVGGRGCRQSLNATVEGGATLIVAPDPLTCFAGASFEQRQRFDLAADGSLVLVDWLTSGRRARGERWAFASCRTRNEVFIDGERVFADATLLEADADAPLSGPLRLGRVDCLAMAAVIGPRFTADAEAVRRSIDSTPTRRAGPADVLFAASPIRGGVLLRAAGPGPEAVGRWLRHSLAFLADALGQDPWARKW